MKLSDDRAVALLQELLTTAVDSAEGYAAATHDVEDPELLQLFGEYRKIRLRIVEELAERMKTLRADPNLAPTAAGAVHRRWMDVRASTSDNPRAALLAEVERGEAVAVAAFRQGVAEHDIDAATRRLLQAHYELVQTAHDRVKQLLDRERPADAFGGRTEL